MAQKKQITYTEAEEFIRQCASGSERYNIYLPSDGEIIPLEHVHTYVHGHALSGCSLHAHTSDEYECADMACIFAGDRLAGMCTVFFYEDEDNTAELYVLVHPDYRRHGIGSRLANYMSDTLNKLNATIYLIGSNSPFADFLGGRYAFSEHYMKRNAGALLAKPEHICRTYKEDDYIICRLFAAKLPVCRCRLDVFTRYVNVSQVYTEESHRSMGYASSLMLHVAYLYPDKDILLQVSGDNLPAIKAYLKSGFYFVQTTDYYLLT